MDNVTETLNSQDPAPAARAEDQASAKQPRTKASRATVKEKEPENRSGVFFYIGPTLRGLLRTGDMFRGGRDAALEAAKEAIEKYPLVKTLIVSGDAFPAARLRLQKQGNALRANYDALRRMDIEARAAENGNGEE